MYADYLNEKESAGFGWNVRMKDSLKCGIVREGTEPKFTYLVKKGKIIQYHMCHAMMLSYFWIGVGWLYQRMLCGQKHLLGAYI